MEWSGSVLICGDEDIRVIIRLNMCARRVRTSNVRREKIGRGLLVSKRTVLGGTVVR